MNQQIRPTGIEAIDARVKEIMRLPKRAHTLYAPFDENFPGRTITRDAESEIIVVGAGWEFPLHATAFVAAGAKVIAYEMTREKFGAGQIGRTMKDDILGFYPAWRLAHLMPDFTPQHLERLPSEIRNIMNLPGYRALSEKRRSIRSKGLQAYRDLHDTEKMSKRKVTETKRGILEHMVAVGVLEVIYQEVTVDMVASWLKNNKPVFLMTGSQFNLEKSGLSHLIGNDRFLKEFVLDSEDTENFIKDVSALQRADAASVFPSRTLPRIGIVGGGAIALSCESDLGELLQPNLEIIHITPEKKPRLPDSLLPAQSSMKHQFLLGYVSDLMLWEDKNAIKTVKIIGFPDGEWGTPFRHAMESITKFLDERAPENGLIRDYAIGPRDYEMEITFRINEPWYLSLEDDEVLVKKIKFLIEQDPDQATIIASGNGPMVKRLIWLAASVGYRGRFFQVVLPTQDFRAVQLSKKLESEGKFIRRLIQGRLKKATMHGEKLILEVHDSNGEPMGNMPDVDFLVNAMGKTTRMPLINGLIENGYIHENDAAQGGTDIHSGHPMLSGYSTVFQRHIGEEHVTSPGMWWNPWTLSPKTQPDGWEKAFNIACKMLGKCP